MTDVNRRERHTLVAEIMMGLHEPTGDIVTDRGDRKQAVTAAMSLLAYVENLENRLDQTRRQLAYSDAELQSCRSNLTQANLQLLDGAAP